MKAAVTIIRVLFLILFFFLILSGKMFLWLALFGVSLVAAIFFARVYCGYVCPMNTLMIPAQWLSKKLKIQTDKAPQWLGKGLFAWVFLLISVAMALITQRVLHRTLPILPIWLAISVLVTLRYKPEVFHNLICPLGTLQGALGRFAFLTKKVDASSCIGCGLCESVCPSGAIAMATNDNKAVIGSGLCHQCTNCSDICPKAAITYGKRTHAKRSNRDAPGEPPAI